MIFFSDWHQKKNDEEENALPAKQFCWVHKKITEMVQSRNVEYSKNDHKIQDFRHISCIIPLIKKYS